MAETDMKHFTIEVAGIKIVVDTISPGTYAYCIRFLSEGRPDISVGITQEDVQREIRESNVDESIVNEQYLETIAVYRKIVEEMIGRGIILMHGAVIAVGDQAFMFTAPSGTGKTTHIRLWLDKIKSSFVVNGDKPLLKITDSEVIACGTPWCGKERMGTNTMVPLKAIVFLERNEENHIEEISFSEAVFFLLKQIYYPSDKDKTKKTFDLLSQLQGKVRFYKFRCNNFRDDCFQTAYDALIGR